MHRFMKRYYCKAGLAILAVFIVQFIAVSFCAIPSVHAAPATMHATMDMQCTMDMPMVSGQNIPECAHCEAPDFSAFSSQATDVPATWTLIAVLPALLHQADKTFEQEQPLFVVSEAPPRSASLIYQKTLRIRL